MYETHDHVARPRNFNYVKDPIINKHYYEPTINKHIYKKIEPYVPQMANVKNNQLKIPCEIIPYKVREWTYRC